MLIHWIWYATLPKLSLGQKLALLEQFSDPEDIYNTHCFERMEGLSPDGAEALGNKDLTQAEQVLEACAQRQLGILTIRDSAYPSRLRNIPDPPLVLYYRGVLPDFEEKPVLAVVGTRKASAYGMSNARSMSRQIAACGGMVISGGAYGVDTAALRGALETGSQTVAVLGCGADVVYPRTNRELFEKISEKGCLLSEYVPGTQARPWQFPERNRILSGISNGVLVIEAPEKSGALITAREALEQGRDVFVVPGNIDVATCAGSNALLQDGAAAVFSGWDALKDYAYQYPGQVEKRDFSYFPDRDITQTKVAQTAQLPKLPHRSDKKDIDKKNTNDYIVLDNIHSQLTEQERKILSCLSRIPRPVDEVIAHTGIPAPEVLRALTKLALEGMVINHPGRLVSAI